MGSRPRETASCGLCCVDFNSIQEQLEHDFSLIHHMKLHQKYKSMSHGCSLCILDSVGSIKAYVSHLNSSRHQKALVSCREKWELNPPGPSALQLRYHVVNVEIDRSKSKMPVFKPKIPTSRPKLSTSKSIKEGHHNHELAKWTNHNNKKSVPPANTNFDPNFSRDCEGNFSKSLNNSSFSGGSSRQNMFGQPYHNNHDSRNRNSNNNFHNSRGYKRNGPPWYNNQPPNRFPNRYWNNNNFASNYSNHHNSHDDYWTWQQQGSNQGFTNWDVNPGNEDWSDDWNRNSGYVDPPHAWPSNDAAPNNWDNSKEPDTQPEPSPGKQTRRSEHSPSGISDSFSKKTRTESSHKERERVVKRVSPKYKKTSQSEARSAPRCIVPVEEIVPKTTSRVTDDNMESSIEAMHNEHVPSSSRVEVGGVKVKNSSINVSPKKLEKNGIVEAKKEPDVPPDFQKDSTKKNKKLRNHMYFLSSDSETDDQSSNKAKLSDSSDETGSHVNKLKENKTDAFNKALLNRLVNYPCTRKQQSQLAKWIQEHSKLKKKLVYPRFNMHLVPTNMEKPEDEEELHKVLAEMMTDLPDDTISALVNVLKKDANDIQDQQDLEEILIPSEDDHKEVQGTVRKAFMSATQMQEAEPPIELMEPDFHEIIIKPDPDELETISSEDSPQPTQPVSQMPRTWHSPQLNCDPESVITSRSPQTTEHPSTNPSSSQSDLQFQHWTLNNARSRSKQLKHKDILLSSSSPIPIVHGHIASTTLQNEFRGHEDDQINNPKSSDAENLLFEQRGSPAQQIPAQTKIVETTIGGTARVAPRFNSPQHELSCHQTSQKLMDGLGTNHLLNNNHSLEQSASGQTSTPVVEPSQMDCSYGTQSSDCLFPDHSHMSAPQVSKDNSVQGSTCGSPSNSSAQRNWTEMPSWIQRPSPNPSPSYNNLTGNASNNSPQNTPEAAPHNIVDKLMSLSKEEEALRVQSQKVDEIIADIYKVLEEWKQKRTQLQQDEILLRNKRLNLLQVLQGSLAKGTVLDHMTFATPDAQLPKTSGNSANAVPDSDGQPQNVTYLGTLDSTWELIQQLGLNQGSTKDSPSSGTSVSDNVDSVNKSDKSSSKKKKATENVKKNTKKALLKGNLTKGKKRKRAEKGSSTEDTSPKVLKKNKKRLNAAIQSNMLQDLLNQLVKKGKKSLNAEKKDAEQRPNDKVSPVPSSIITDNAEEKNAELPPRFETFGPLEAHGSAILEIKVSNGYIYTCSADRTAKKFEIENPQNCVVYKDHEKTVSALQVITSEGGQDQIFTTSHDGYLRCFESQSGQVLHELYTGSSILCMAKGWGKLYLGLNNGEIWPYKINSVKFLDVFGFLQPSVAKIAIGTEGLQRLLCVVTYDGRVSVRNAVSGLLIRLLDRIVRPPCCLQVEGSEIYITTTDRTICVYEISSGRLLRTLNCPSSATGLYIIDDYIFSCSFDGLIRCYLKKNWTLHRVYYGAGKNMTMSMTILDGWIFSGNRHGFVEAIKPNHQSCATCLFQNCGCPFGYWRDLRHHLKVDHLAKIQPDSALSWTKCPWKSCAKLLLGKTGEDKLQELEDHIMDHVMNV